MKIILIILSLCLVSCGKKISAGKDAKSVGKSLEKVAKKVGEGTEDIVKDVADATEELIKDIKGWIKRSFDSKDEAPGQIIVHTYNEPTVVELSPELEAQDSDEGSELGLEDGDDLEVDYSLEGEEEKELVCTYQRSRVLEKSRGKYVLKIKKCLQGTKEIAITKVVWKIKKNGRFKIKVKFLQHLSNLLIENGIAKRDLELYNKNSKRKKIRFLPLLIEGRQE